MSDQDNRRAAVEAGYAPLSDYVADKYSVKEILGPGLYRPYLDIAIREHSSVLTVVRDILRKNIEGVA